MRDACRDLLERVDRGDITGELENAMSSEKMVLSNIYRTGRGVVRSLGLASF